MNKPSEPGSWKPLRPGPSSAFAWPAHLQQCLFDLPPVLRLVTAPGIFQLGRLSGRLSNRLVTLCLPQSAGMLFGIYRFLRRTYR